MDQCVRAGPLLLLLAAHPAHSRPRGHRVEGAFAGCHVVAVHQSPDGKSAAARRLHLEPGPAVSRLGGRRAAVVFPVALVRQSQGAPRRLVAEVPLEGAAATAAPTAARAAAASEPRATRAAG